MSKLQEVWKQKSKKDIALSITIMTGSVAVIILAALQLLGIWENAINVFEPLIGVVMLLQAIQNWNKNRGVAIVSLLAALFVFGCAIIILIL